MTQATIGSRVTALRSTGNLRQQLSRVMPLVVLVALVLAVASEQPSFLKPASLRALAEGATVILLPALGLTVVIIMGGIDLSIAAMASMATVLLASWIPAHGWGAVLLVIAICAAAGAAQGFIHAKGQVPSFIVTLGGLALWSGIALIASKASAIPLRDKRKTLGWFTDTTGGVPHGVVYALLAMAAVGALLKLLPAGRQLFALGMSEPATVMSGTRVVLVKTLAFAVSGTFGALTAVFLVARGNSGGPSLADSLLLPAIAAVVVGGTAITGGIGSVWQTLTGALIIAVLRVAINVLHWNPHYEQIFYGVFVIVAVGLTIDRRKLSAVK